MKITALPAKRGDSFLVEYAEGPKLGRILVDCGFKTSYSDSIRRALASLPGTKAFKLLVVTHVDLDHINGVLKMFEDGARPVSFDDVWFNTFEHLQGKRVVQPELEDFGGPQGEQLSAELIAQNQPWNRAFDGRPVTTTTPMTPIDDQLRITVVSPTVEQLSDLIPKWAAECEKAGVKVGFQPTEPDDTTSPFEAFGALTVNDVRSLAASRFDAEDSDSNGSTVALLIEHDLYAALLTGDAATPQLVAAVGELAREAGGKLPLDLMQVPHHGSRGNISKELLELVHCQRFIVSTDGSSHGHPHDEAIARILVFGGDHEKELIFNYADRATRWRSATLEKEFKYTVRTSAPADGDGTVNVDLAQT